MANNRRKGHDLERQVAAEMREIYNTDTIKTSREVSRLLDNCKIDIWGLPLNIQAKNGYEKSQPNYRRLRDQSTELLTKSFPKTDPIHNNPYVLIHKTPGNDITVTVDYEYFKYLLKKSLD